jgi:hypothetical protein
MSSPTTGQSLVRVLLQATQAALKLRGTESASETVRDEADSALELAFAPIWKSLSSIELDISADAIRLGGLVVLGADDDDAGLISSLVGSSIRSLTLVPGVEVEEIKLVLTAISADQRPTGKDGTDLLTSLFRADLNYVQYGLEDTGPGDAAGATKGQHPRIATPEPERTGSRGVIREAVRQDAAAPAAAPAGVVRLEKFDSTLYFLDDREIEYLKSSIDREYARDLALNTLSLLLDILQLRTDQAVREEVIGILSDFLPDLLGAGRFEAVAYLISGVREVSREAIELTDPQKDALDRLRASISRPRALAQLFYALEGGAVAPTPESMGVLLRELRPVAIRQVLAWSGQLSDPGTRNAVVFALDSFFTEWPLALSRMVSAPERGVVQAGLDLASRLKHPEFVEIVSAVATHDDPVVRRMVAETLASIGDVASFRRLTGLAEDTDRDVRVVVYRALAARPFRGAHAALLSELASKDLEKKDQREKRALFEAFGAVSGNEGVADLTLLLCGKSLSGPRPSPHTRACAATALGVIATPDARSALDQASEDRDPLVRRAVNAALRGER